MSVGNQIEPAGQAVRGALICLLAFLQSSLPAAETPSRAAVFDQLSQSHYRVIKLRRTGDDHLFLWGQVDGQRQTVLVDTGWSFTTISTNAAKNLVRTNAAAFDRENLKSSTAVSTAQIKELQLDRARFTNQPVLIENILMNGQPAGFDLVLGCDFLFRHFAIIDCANDRLFVRDAAPSTVEQAELAAILQQAGFIAVNLSRTQPPGLTCSTTVNGEPVEMLVDTAGVFSCLDERLIQSFALKPIVSPRKLSGIGETGTRPLQVVTVKTFSVGNVEWTRHNFAALALGDWGIGQRDTGLQNVRGIFGGPELAVCNAIIDLHAGKLWVKRSRFR